MSSRCSICSNPLVEDIDTALGDGASIRATASQFSVSRPSLARHRKHAVLAEAGSSAGRDPLAEAARQLARASSERERLRGLEGVRAAYTLHLRDWRRARIGLKAPNPAELDQLEAHVEACWAQYERVASGSLDVALRALVNVREAISQLEQARSRLPEPPEEFVPVTIDLCGVPVHTHFPASLVPESGEIKVVWPEIRSGRPDHNGYG